MTSLPYPRTPSFKVLDAIDSKPTRVAPEGGDIMPNSELLRADDDDDSSYKPVINFGDEIFRTL